MKKCSRAVWSTLPKTRSVKQRVFCCCATVIQFCTISIIIIIMHRLPLGRFQAPTSSTSPCRQPSSSFPHTRHSFSFLSSTFPLTHFPRPFPYKTLLLDH